MARASDLGQTRVMAQTILYVDDEADLAGAIEAQLEDYPFDLAFCRSAEDALDVIRDREIHIIVLDLGLPGMSGFDFLKMVRKDHPNLPVIIVTGFKSKLALDRAAQLGCTVFLEKPFSFNDLITKIQGLISG